MRLLFIMFLLHLLVNTGRAQYFQFSQSNFAGQRINPAIVASSDYALLDFLYRNQTTGGDLNLNSTFVSGCYPFLSTKTGRRWSGLGLSLLDDRSGNIYTIQEAALSYAANVYLSRSQTLSLGVKGLYQQRKMDLDGLFTGMQYIQDRGFDESIFSGENLQQLRNDFFTLSLGVLWQQLDRNNHRQAYISLSFFDFNKPQDSFLGAGYQLRTTIVAAAGARVYENGPLSVIPELLYTGNYSTHVLNVGMVTQYSIRSVPNQVSSTVDLITKYVIGRSGIVGLQFSRENFSIGFSYDFPVLIKNPGNLGAFELGLQVRRLVDPKLKRSARNQKNTKNPTTVTSRQKRTNQQPPVKLAGDTTSSLPQITEEPVKGSLKQNLREKQDSLLTSAQVGDLSRDPVELEKVLLHFNFEFNSRAINAESADYLSELADVLKDNEHLRINLVGHTDNIGSDAYNMRLSLERAKQVKNFLVRLGVHPDRIDTGGKGLREPLNENITEEDRAKNRRVELNIIYSFD
jgi:type IX secretion system PorP/SprF family membrane protein